LRRYGSGRRSVSLVLAALAIISLLVVAQWLRTRDAPLPTTARLVVVGGRALVTRADAGADPPRESGASTTLQRGDRIETGQAGRARLTFRGGEVTELSPGTSIEILELHQAPLSRGLVVLLALDGGQTLTRIRHMLFQGSRFAIDTRVVTVEAKGTVFQCDVLAKNRVYVAVHEGVVQVSMGEQRIELEAGQGIEAELGQPLAPVAAIVPLATGEVLPLTPLSTQPTAHVDAPPTLTSLQRTLFPPAVTPTRAGDGTPLPTREVPPAASLYEVQEGDTLYGIARSLGVSWETLWEMNRDALPQPELIRPGQKLQVPATD